MLPTPTWLRPCLRGSGLSQYGVFSLVWICSANTKRMFLELEEEKFMCHFCQVGDFNQYIMQVRDKRNSKQASSSGAALHVYNFQAIQPPFQTTTGTTEKNAKRSHESPLQVILRLLPSLLPGGVYGDVTQRPDFEAKVAKLVELGFAR
ncbi:hypothetical protein V6N13_142276 [Hibiscus sabdariffa]